TVVGLDYDEDQCLWTTRTSDGERVISRFVVAATGALSVPIEPDVPGVSDFDGEVLFTSRYPHEGVDLRGKRVGVIGTGSSGVQVISAIAPEVGLLCVFQRTATYSYPALNRKLRPGEMDRIKSEYPELRARQRQHPAGTIGFGAVSFDFSNPPTRRILESTPEERLAAIDEVGWKAPLDWADVMIDMEANGVAVELYAELVSRVVTDPETARRLSPKHPIGCRRTVLDTAYFETYNRDNVSLVDISESPWRVVRDGVEVGDRSYRLDVLILATGFDAMTGALNRIDIRGRGGRLLRDEWNDGPHTMLGIQVHGFPNLFIIGGPGSPSVLGNVVQSIELHVEWMADLLTTMAERGWASVDPTHEAVEEWTDHVAEVGSRNVIRASAHCNTWYHGSNVPGKRRVFLPYAGGIPAFRARCEGIAAAGYTGFVFDRVSPTE
ncbi:MAG: NAD(P)/FAD-dependent oxidoreductase, partial [Mycetocola sp.]